MIAKDRSTGSIEVDRTGGTAHTKGKNKCCHGSHTGSKAQHQKATMQLRERQKASRVCHPGGQSCFTHHSSIRSGKRSSPAEASLPGELSYLKSDLRKPQV